MPAIPLRRYPLSVIAVLAPILTIVASLTLSGVHQPGRAAVAEAGASPESPGFVSTQTSLAERQVSWTPEAIFNDGVESTLFEVRINSGRFDNALISTNGVLDSDPVLPAETASLGDELIQIFDDGSHGDILPGDRIFSRSGITASGRLQHDGGTHQTLRNNVILVDGYNYFAQSTETGVSVVDAGQRGRVRVTPLGPDLSATSHALFLVDDGTIFPTYPRIDATSVVDECLGCGILTDRFGDVFDFIILGTAELTKFEGPNGIGRDDGLRAFFSLESNDAEGTGRPLFNNSFANPFTDGRLQGIVFNGFVEGGSLAHELMHRFALRLDRSLSFPDGTGHYVNQSDIVGIMDSGTNAPRREIPFAADADFATQKSDYVANGDGTYRLVRRIGPSNPTFSPIALYLAGFIPPEQVAPITTFRSVNASDPDRVLVTVARTTTIDEVIAAHGTRVPFSADAQRDFSVGTIIIKDRPFTEAEFTYSTLMLRSFESGRAYDGFGPPPWRAATLGQSTITTALPGGQAPQFEPEPQLEAGLTISLPITRGFNLLGWMGDTAVGDAAATLNANFDTIFAFDPRRKTFASFSPSAPRFVNTLDALQAGSGLWVLSSGSGRWQQPLPDGPLSLPLARGFNLVVWTGREGRSVADAAASLGGSLNAVFTWDSITQSFRSFSPTAPTFLNDAGILRLGEGVWVDVSRDVTWDQGG